VIIQTVTNYFIANLSIADVMIGCLSIPFQFQAALLQRWDLPVPTPVPAALLILRAYSIVGAIFGRCSRGACP